MANDYVQGGSKVWNSESTNVGDVYSILVKNYRGVAALVTAHVIIPSASTRAGVLYLQGSMTGEDWVNLEARNRTTGVVSGSWTIAASTAYDLPLETDSGFRFFRLFYDQSAAAAGTMTAYLMVNNYGK